MGPGEIQQECTLASLPLIANVVVLSEVGVSDVGQPGQVAVEACWARYSRCPSQILLEKPKTFPGQMRVTSFQWILGLPWGLRPGEHEQKTLNGRRHPNQKAPQLAPFNMPMNRLYSELSFAVQAPYPFSKAEPVDPTEEKLISDTCSRLNKIYLNSFSCGSNSLSVRREQSIVSGKELP